MAFYRRRSIVGSANQEVEFGIKVVEKACRENGVEVDPKVKDIFTHYRKTHNDGVFDAYTEEIRSFRSLGFLTGLPDNYARGRTSVITVVWHCMVWTD